MGYRVLYFYKMENTFYREKKDINLPIAEKELGEKEDPFLKVFFCGVPEYYGRQVRHIGLRRGKKMALIPWNSGQLLRLMQNCCEYVSADAYYLEEHFERELEESEFGFTPGRQRMCGKLINRMIGQFRGIDSILYLTGETEGRAGELPIPEKLLQKLHCFFYLGERAEQYEALEENLWQEYGMPLLPVGKTEELATCQIKRLLVIDDRQEGEADWGMLPRGCVYLDLWSNAGRQQQIAERRVDIKYVSEYQYLSRNLDT